MTEQKMVRPLALRPHHGLCIRHFTGKGYSPAFVENMACVIAALRAEPAAEILLATGADTLCVCCPHNRGGVCASAPKPCAYDVAVLRLCDLEPGQRICWRDFQKLVERRILRPGLLETVCAGCQWLEICRSQNNK